MAASSEALEAIFTQCDEQAKASKDLLEQAQGMMWYKDEGDLERVATFHRAAQVHATLANYYATRAQIIISAARAYASFIP